MGRPILFAKNTVLKTFFKILLDYPKVWSPLPCVSNYCSHSIIVLSVVTGNESVPKFIVNNTINLFFLNCNQHFGNFKPYQFPTAV